MTALLNRTQASGMPIMFIFSIGMMGCVILLDISAPGATAAQYSARYF